MFFAHKKLKKLPKMTLFLLKTISFFLQVPVLSNLPGDPVQMVN